MHLIGIFRLGVLGVWLFAGNVLFADDWPQWLGPSRDAIWREDGIIEKFPTNGPPVRWRAAIGGGYAGPSVAKGRVYVADRRLATGDQLRTGALPERSRRHSCFGNTNTNAPTRSAIPPDPASRP